MTQVKNLISFFPSVQNSRVLSLFEDSKNLSISGAGNFSAKVFSFVDVARRDKRLSTVLWVVNDETEKDNVVRSLQLWSDFEVMDFSISAVEGVKAKQIQRENNIKLLEFTETLGNLRKKIIVAPYFSLMGNFPDIEEMNARVYTVKNGAKLQLTDFYERIIDLGYQVADDDKELQKGEYVKRGDVVTIFPLNYDNPVSIDIGFEGVESLLLLNGDEKPEKIDQVTLYQVTFDKKEKLLNVFFNNKVTLIEDEVDVIDEFYEQWSNLFDEAYEKIRSLAFVTFNDDDRHHVHLHYISVMKYRGAYDLANDFRDKYRDGWKIVFFSKEPDQVQNVLEEYKLQYSDELFSLSRSGAGICIIPVDKEGIFPHAFQNPELKLMVISDKEVSFLRDDKKKHFNQKIYLDFLTSLKTNDYVVHVSHGIGKFLGLDKKTIDEVTREYLKIGYAENDKLFVPIDQADKVNKYIGADDQPPHLTRLGSSEWNTITKKVQKETEIIAKELLQLYAERKSAKGVVFKHDSEIQRQFEEAFPYEETPGQLRAIVEVKKDMEKSTPMDRLVCGDVGFGKTEVAMRAAFKAVLSKKQVALVSPITILADQHYRSFVKRMEGFDVRIELMSRFRTIAQQKETLRRLARGEVDIVIGTHRLLQKDVIFKDLGLVIIDEEQRFGVKQKEALKQMKTEVDVLTLTATPIPRTLNIALNKLRDISTITTPPPGRLPIITEVRRYSQGLIREAILREIARGGQVYFLHNRVQTIDGIAEKLRTLVPEARFGVAHGKLGSNDLEERILDFKDHKFDVLVCSTIIENGIDLANANTLIVNNADKLGLAQLYQLRGRVGRGRQQAYAFFLYHGQRLKLDAKKRLRAIVEASELGSGFQIAMKDLEIRGAGDILGAKQHGVINVVGVSHFIRMLNKAVDDLKAGKVTRAEEPEEVSIELPISAYIPDNYINSSKDKINAYQRMSAADSMEYLDEIRDDLIEEYGKLPNEVMNLFHVLELKILAKKANLVSIKAESGQMNKGKEIVLHLSQLVKPENIMNLLEYHSKWYISGTRLRVKMEDLGLHWFDTLRESLVRLAGKISDQDSASTQSKSSPKA